VIYGKLKRELEKILRELSERKRVEIFEAEACPDHIHMLVSISPKHCVLEFMGYFKENAHL
jgi:putative transposase